MNARPEPTWVNHEFIRGPIYNYLNITDAQASSLGINPLPECRFGATSKVHQAVARRLRSGLLNVSIPHGSALLSGILCNALPSGPREAEPLQFAWEKPDCKILQPGQWSIEVATQRVSWSRRMYELAGVEPGSVRTVEDVAGLVNQSDRDRLMKSVISASIGGCRIDETYTIVVDGAPRRLHSRGRPIGFRPGQHSERISGMTIQMIG